MSLINFILDGTTASYKGVVVFDAENIRKNIKSGGLPPEPAKIPIPRNVFLNFMEGSYLRLYTHKSSYLKTPPLFWFCSLIHRNKGGFKMTPPLIIDLCDYIKNHSESFNRLYIRVATYLAQYYHVVIDTPLHTEVPSVTSIYDLTKNIPSDTDYWQLSNLIDMSKAYSKIGILDGKARAKYGPYSGKPIIFFMFNNEVLAYYLYEYLKLDRIKGVIAPVTLLRRGRASDSQLN